MGGEAWRKVKKTILEGKISNMWVDTHTFRFARKSMASLPRGGSDMLKCTGCVGKEK